MVLMFLLCVFMLHFREYVSQKNLKKASAVIIVRSGLEKVYFIFYWKEMIGSSLTNHWLDIDLRTPKRYGYVGIGKLFQTLSGA